MFIVGLLGWWYGAGWQGRLRLIGERLARAQDFFSIDLLLKTWFSPFRQIGTEGGGRGLSEQMRAMLDKLVSRLIGGIIRTFMIIFGALWLAFLTVAGLVELVLWFVVPAFPVVGLLLFAIGWVPGHGV